VVGPPVARWAISCEVSSLVEPTRRFELAAARGLLVLQTLAGPTGDSPRARRSVTGTPATPLCAVPSTLQVPATFAVGLSLEDRFVSATELRNRSALSPEIKGKLPFNKAETLKN